MHLPIPSFVSVEKCYYVYDPQTDERVVRIIAHDPFAGLEKRYSVIELDLTSGGAICIGRELPKKFAKKIAKKGLKKVGKVGPIIYYKWK